MHYQHIMFLKENKTSFKPFSPFEVLKVHREKNSVADLENSKDI